MDKEVLSITRLKPAEIDRAARFFGYAPGGDDDQALRHNMAESRWTVVLAAKGDDDVAGFYLNWAPKYRLYQRLNMPELQDLRVHENHRAQGIGEKLVLEAESIARDAGAHGMGLSVGLHAAYGAAQRLYARMNYIPDGNGVTYDRETMQAGAKCTLDDDLALMLLKFF